MIKTFAKKAIIEFSRAPIKSTGALLVILKQIAEKEKIEIIGNDLLFEAYNDLVAAKKLKADKKIEKILRIKKVRSLSGIVVVSLLTKPYPCPGKCLYCPTEKDLPKSYVENEPAVMRAKMNAFDPYLQTFNRLKALKIAGHPVSKVNIRIIGGTWSFYPKTYQTWFVKQIFKAANEFGENYTAKKSLNDYQKVNETAKCRIVEISIETRQDFINTDEIKRLRNLGVTKVELGVQSLDDGVLTMNRRGHDVNETVKATKLLKDAGFKVAYQMMLNLPGSSIKKDFLMMKRLFTDADFQPDYLKIYPLAVIKNTGVYELYKRKKFKPYSEEELTELIANIKKIIPPYVRIERVIRDIPSYQITEGGAKISNLRQVVVDKLKKENSKCQCIRCREIKIFKKEKTKLFQRIYSASCGKEIFLSIESDEGTLYSLLRLRLPKKTVLKELKSAVLVREMHTYGYQINIGEKSSDAAQHRGFGKKLLKAAEKIAKKEGFDKVAVISGIGVRDYFRKLGYRLVGTYMVKGLK